ncbi:hypothetical protein C1645_739302 [Glomus cerebriforme]|uniref:Uncharacterized protein n=1 Tax=Glomus cerebriforme TaxID=658196 RepID=A0A397SRF7_9GLOM|nr:hypothetical protein C1645_739302 [Glomus cerebriforme]
MATHGKCKYRNMQNGFECGCLRSRVQNDDYLCKACKHDLCYHEINQPQTSSNNINDQLNGLNGRIIRKTNRQNKLNPYKRPIIFKLIYISGPKIPRGLKKLEKFGLMKPIYFTDDSDDGIKRTVISSFPHLTTQNWRFFRCSSTADLVIVDEPDIGWSIDALKSIACTRRKLYVGIVDEQSQMTLPLIDQQNIIFEQFIQQNFMSRSQEEIMEFNYNYLDR